MRHSPLADLPMWVVDLVIALEEHHDTHPQYYAKYWSSGYEIERAATCGCEPLAVIPTEVRQMIADHAVTVEADLSP
jgi:hypothetical protein